MQGSRQRTYAELNSRANQLGRALLAQGLRREDVVRVVTERNLDWLAAVLAVFKAGGAYLPIEPHFPPDRIATTLSRAGCRLVLSEPESITNLNQALDGLPGVRKLLVGEAYTQAHPDGDLGVDVSADQLAYIYFTSGSTGVPKGVMCEHVGMVNHLFAKIDDLSIGEGHVVGQTAPQCFDISLWQLVSALLVGGRTLLVEQDVVLDVPRWVSAIVEGRASVVQVVPSYLEAVLAYLEQHPHELPDLRCVSATGEALKKELILGVVRSSMRSLRICSVQEAYASPRPRRVRLVSGSRARIGSASDDRGGSRGGGELRRRLGRAQRGRAADGARTRVDG